MTDPKAPSDPLGYWSERLAEAPPTLELPTAQSRSADQSYRSGRRDVGLAGDVLAALRTLGASHGASLDDVYLCGFLGLLHRIGGQVDLVVGVADADGVLPLRVDLSGEPSFGEFVQRVTARRNEDKRNIAPLEAIATRALFPALFATTTASELPTSCRALDVVVRSSDEGLTLEYNAELFDDAAIGRMAGHLTTLLGGLAAQPDVPVGLLPLLADAERHQILVEWNAKDVDFPRDATLHGLFEERARSCPDAVAATFRGDELTYRQLDERANQVAHHLRGLGVGPEVMVGVSIERSLELVVGLMGLAKAGGAYVPMDPAYPLERLTYMIKDSKVKVLLTQKHFAGALPSGDATVVLLDEPATFDALSTEAQNSGADSQSLAYVIYTSGSTGAPKGVVLNHQGRVNNFLDFNRRFSVGQGDGLIALASLSFDMCAYDVFGTLAAGSTIVLPEPSGLQDPAHWAQLMNARKVTIWHTAPAMLKMLVDYLEGQPALAPQSLRLVLLGGDWIPGQPARPFARARQ